MNSEGKNGFQELCVRFGGELGVSLQGAVTIPHFAGVCCHRGLQRPRGAGGEVLQGGGHGHPRGHHPGQAVHRARATRLLGQQDREAAHGALQGACPAGLALGLFRALLWG